MIAMMVIVLPKPRGGRPKSPRALSRQEASWSAVILSVVSDDKLDGRYGVSVLTKVRSRP
jgi:hypothetical protein